jgi:WD40 repeat protein
MCGIAGIDSGYICVGSSVGTIAVIHCGGGDDSDTFSMHKLLGTRQEKAIFAAGGSASLLACGNDFGDVHLYNAKSNFEQLCEFRGFGYPCTSIVLNDDAVVCAYSSGHIRIFRTDSLEMAIEVTAHIRCINALALHPELRLFASCGEDQFVNVWALPEFHRVGSNTTELLFSERFPNRLLTGIAFCRDSKLAATSYDEEDLILLSKIA